MSISQPRILCLFSAPLVTPDGKALAALDIQTERNTIVREINACRRQAVMRIGHATVDELALGISDGFNVLHLSGHGHPDFLLFEDEKGGSHPVTGEYLKKLIATGGPFELAVVSACHSERIANLIVQAGVRHVVAIKCEVPVLDAAAIAFIGQFFRNLFRGSPIQKAFEMAKLLVEGNAQLAKLKPDLELLAYAEGEPYVPEEEKFVLLPTGNPSGHLDPLVSAEVPAGVVSLEAVPLSKCNLPARPHVFTGRSIEMYSAVNELLANRLVTVTGAGGIGKTTLAMEVARWFHTRGHFPDGVFHVDLRQVQTAGEMLAMIGAALDKPFAEVADALAYLKECRCLLLLDNMENLLWADEGAAQAILDKLLKFAPDVRFLVTAQRQIGGVLHEPERVCRLYPLRLRLAISLFRSSAKRALSEAEYNSDSFRTLHEQMGGHPLSIVVMARQLTPGVSIDDLVDRITKHKAKAIQIGGITDASPGHGESLAACLSSAYANVSGNGKLLLQVLSMLPAGAQEFTIKQLLGEAAWDDAQELNDACLAEITLDRRVILLPPVRLYALGLLSEEVRQEHGMRIVDLMAAYAEQFYEGVYSVNAKQYSRFFTIEEPNLRSATELPSAPAGESASALGWLGLYLIQLYTATNRHADVRGLGDHILARLNQLKDTLGEANTLRGMGDLAVRTGELSEAKDRYEKALTIFRQIDEKLGEANTLVSLGQWFALRSELVQADGLIASADTIYSSISDLDGAADVCSVRALIHLSHGHDKEGEEQLAQCLAIRQKILGCGDAALRLILYADHLQSKKAAQQARTCLRYARELARQAKDLSLLQSIDKRMDQS